MANEKKDLGYNLEIKLEVFDIHSIKPRTQGSFKSDDGEEISYGYAVKFKTIKVEEVPDEDFGTKELEKILEVEVPCDTMSETVMLNNHLMAMKKSGKTFKIDITSPNKVKGSSKDWTAKSILHHKDFINEYKL